MLLPCLKEDINPDVDLIESDANSEKAVEAPCSLLAISSMRFSYPTWQNHAKSMNPRGAEHLKRFLLDQVGWVFLEPVGSFWLWERTLVSFVDIRWEQRCQGQAWRWRMEQLRYQHVSTKNKMKPTNPNADTYVEKQRLNTYLSQFPANPVVEHPDLTHWGDTLVGHPCLTLLRYALVRHSCMTLWFDTLAGHSCLTLF